MSINITGSAGIGPVSDSRGPRADQKERAATPPAADNSDNRSNDRSNDEVALSPQAQSLREVEADVRALPDVDLAKVEEIRAAVAEGRYHVDADKVASKIIELESELDF